MRKKILIKQSIQLICGVSVVCSSPLVIFASNGSGSGFNEDHASLPNYVLIVIDDLGYGDLGIYGNKVHQTPNMDHLARGGMLFTDFHSNGAVCSPTRAAMMTGQYQQRSGVEHAIGFVLDEGMPLEKMTIAELLKAAGYVSGVFGKWHLGHISNYGPNSQGFDHSYASNNTPDYHTHISRVGEYDWYKDHKEEVEDGYLTDLVTAHSIDFIDLYKDKPFFLFISHLAVHFPFQGPGDPPHRMPGKIWHETKFGPLPEHEYRRAYKDMLEAVDRSIGEVLNALEAAGLTGNTLVFITSDNGAYSWVGSNFPYRGQKGDLFEGGHRIPAIAYWPGKISGGVITDVTAMTMDIAPTILSIAGQQLPDQHSFDGVDLSGVLFENIRLEERMLFWRFHNPYEHSRSYAVRKGAWKYMVTDTDRFLFHLQLDPTESNNLVHIYPGKADLFEYEYKQWDAGVHINR